MKRFWHLIGWMVAGVFFASCSQEPEAFEKLDNSENFTLGKGCYVVDYTEVGEFVPNTRTLLSDEILSPNERISSLTYLLYEGDELVKYRKISDIDNEIARISEQNLVLVRLKSKGYVDSALYLSQMDEIEHKLRELRKLRRRLLETAGEDRQIQETERMLEYLTDSPEWLDEVTSDLFRELIERITIISPTRLKFRLLNGLELSESIERMIR